MSDVLTRSTTLAPAAVPVHADADAHGVYGKLVKLADVPINEWSALTERALEPNAFYHPGWARAAGAYARGHSGARALLAYDSRHRLIGFLPVRSAWRALKMPLPVLVSWQAYAPLTTPILDRERAEEAATGLIDAAAKAGAHAVLLTNHSAHGKATDAFYRVLRRRRASPRILSEHQRALLDATREPEQLLHDSLGSKKLKELRRQRNRLADDGPVTFDIATEPKAIADALEDFLALEAEGWKGRRGTALALHEGDAKFIREATASLARDGHCRLVTLTRAGIPVAVGIVLRHGRRAYFFKLAYDETLARLSPGVQLTLELTRHLTDDAGIFDADSIADADHPMIDHIWRDRLAIATTLMPTRADDIGTAILEKLLMTRAGIREISRNAYHFLRNSLETSR